MSLSEYGAYIRLLQRQWIEGSIPADPTRLARLLRVTDDQFTESVDPFLDHKFPLTAPGRRANPQLSRIRDKILSCQRMPTVFDRFNSPIERRRARERKAGLVTPKLRMAIYDRDGFSCVSCGADDRLSIDHIHPISLGGMTEPANLQTLCRSCNARKGAR